jgi:hypothetical protein
MNTYIAVATTQPQSQPNGLQNSNDVPINLGTGAVGTVLVLSSVLLTKLSALIDWKDVGKQWSGSQTSKVLQAENRKGQELEAEIDINQGLSDTVSRLASRGMDTTTEITKDLLHLVSDAIQTSSANAHSLQSLARANESVNKAHEDLINATKHNTEAVQALEQAIAAIPKETASVIEVYATELRIALDNIDRRIEESNQIKHEGYAAIERAIKHSETRIIEQYTDTMAQLRREFKELVVAVKCPKNG